METKQASHSELGFSPDALAERKAELLALLKQTAPELMSDNQLDLERLKELLGEERIAPAEHYELSWAGKTAARREIQKTSSHTLLPDANNPDRAPHMLIEGENLEVLRALQKSYHGKVKMIYIDPPYNTGSDSFVYPDDYSETLDEYQKRTGEKNEAGFLNKQSLWKKNSKESGQYHSAWLSMMYPRLYLARNLLREDGVIFISVDDNEAANLKLLCDEVFGAESFVADLIWTNKEGGGGSDSLYFRVKHEHIIVYAKNLPCLTVNGVEISNADRYTQEDEYLTTRGKFYLQKLGMGSIQYSASLDYEIRSPDGSPIYPKDNNGGKRACWRWSRPKYEWGVSNGFIEIKKDSKNIWTVYTKQYMKCDNEGNEIERTQRPVAVIDNFSGTQASKQMAAMGLSGLFDYSKPSALIKYLIELVDERDSIIIDFFAGSGTTAQAVMELNLDDGGNRQCICVQLPELLDEKSEAYKAGYRTIADITRARIDKVIAKLKAEHPDKTADLACAHFTLATSNFKIWNSDIADSGKLRQQLALFQSAEKNPAPKPSAQAQTAMLSELLLKHGLGALGVHAVSKSLPVAGVTVHRVLMPDDSVMWLCFEPYSAALKDEIVKAKPAQVVLLNSCFVGDKADELLANLQLELSGLDIGLTII